MAQPGEEEPKLTDVLIKHAPHLVSSVSGLKRRSCQSISLFPAKHCTAENALRLATLEVRIAEAVAKPAEAELQRCGMANAYSGAYVCKLLSATIREACRPVY